MVLALLAEPSDREADAAILLWHSGGPIRFGGDALIGAAALSMGLRQITPRDRNIVRFETPVGVIAVSIARAGERVTGASCAAPPAFVLAGGMPVALGHRSVPVDLAYGGEFYAIVDAEAAGVSSHSSQAAELRRVAAGIVRAVESSTTVSHPVDSSMRGVSGVIFTGPAERTDAHLRAVPVYADGTIARSPSGGGSAALCAVLHAMGLAGTETVVFESAVGGVLRARIEGAALVGDVDAVRVRIDGEASPIGEHVLLFEPDDPLREGFSW